MITNRIAYIDIAKALGIFLVILGHIVSSNTLCKEILYAFHMPLFFLLSGALIKEKEIYDAETWRTFLKKRFSQLMIPYLLFGLIYASFSFKNLAFLLYGTREALIHAGSLTSLWFLPVLFIANIIVEIILHIYHGKLWYHYAIAIIVIFIIGMIFPHFHQLGDLWGIDIAFVAAFFMLLAKCLRPLFDKMTENLKLSSTVFFLCIVIFTIILPLNHTDVGYVLMANAIYGNRFIFVFTAIIGSLSVLALAMVMVKCRLEHKCITFVGQNTLGIFLVHKPFVELGRKLTLFCGFDYNNLMIALIITFASLLFSLIVIRIIENYVPVFLGYSTNKYKV